MADPPFDYGFNLGPITVGPEWIGVRWF